MKHLLATVSPPVSIEKMEEVRKILKNIVTQFDLGALGLTEFGAEELIKNQLGLEEDLAELIKDLLVKNLGIDISFGVPVVEFDLIVPSDYNHDVFLMEGLNRIRRDKETHFFNESELIVNHFSGIPDRLEPGKTYRVAFFPIVKKYVPEEISLRFLREQQALLVGMRGLLLLQSLKIKQLPQRLLVCFDGGEMSYKVSPNDENRAPFMFPSSNKFSYGTIGSNLALSNNCIVVAFFQK